MEWTAARVTDLLDKLRRRRGDSTTVEVKRAAGGVPQSLPETICAFADMPGGGTIILGADEHTDFSINGVDDPAAMEAAVANQARQFVTPSPYLEAVSAEIQGVMVTVVQVTGLNPLQKPATYKGEAYLRQADGDYVKGANDLHMIEVAKLHELTYVQKELLASLLHGDEWSVERLTRDFSPLTVEEATEVLSQLTRRGLVAVDLDAASQISLARNSTAGSQQKEGVPDVTGTQEGGPALLSKNGGLILRAVEEGADTVLEMMDATGLTRRQVDYALKQLLSAGVLIREGGQGHRRTFYRLPG